MANNTTQFTIPRDGYLTFDALTMKQFIKDRLNDNKVFTDQNYEGSYISTINEIISYVFHGLMYYLNRTSTESMFSEAQIYENMNRIVKQLDYNPIGKQTASTTFSLSGSENIPIGLYTIPRYSYVTNGNISYSINEDIVLSKLTSELESFDEIVSQKLLYQGNFIEYPIYQAVGNMNEVVYFAPGDDILVDHFNIDVYVYENTSTEQNKWYKWNRVPTLYLENGSSRSFEIRLNENKRYEIKFGNDVNGKQLKINDKVAIYYLQILGTEGEIGANSFTNETMRLFTSNTFNSILNDLNTREGNRYTYITSDIANNLSITNTNNSTYYQEEEDVDAIRKNAPGVFRSQYRVVTEADYENYIKTNFANLVHDIKAVNNWTYLSEQMKYYYEDIGLGDPNSISNILYNQLNFADACNFNNVYITAVPKTIQNTKNPTSVLSPAQKELITTSLRGVKTLTSEVIIIDPVYISTDLCIPADGTTNADINDIDNTELLIIKDPNSRRDDNSIILNVASIFTDYFDRSNISLGQILDISTLTTSILAIPGVKTFYTRRKDDNTVQYAGLAMLAWNPVYLTDRQLITKNTSFAYFKYLFLNNKESFKNKIKVTSSTKIYENIEY
ncbi:MAG: hypothetical protein PHS54_00035 [Clostridia bacterium]|nr:hypothetical protein [Clostridia bacterium]